MVSGQSPLVGDATMAFEVRAVSPVPPVLGPYRIEAEIGHGAMGAVYRAEHTKLKRMIALKILPVEFMVPDRLARFHREMEAIGCLDHPNIVRATDAGEIDGFHYLAMELVTGSDLASLISRIGRIDVGSACEIIRQAALGLQCLHEHKLVHRDIKPSNLFLSTEGIIKLLDLGIAMLRKDTDETRATSMGAMMGTPDYIAPEQIEHARDVDIRADIYSLGCTLFTFLTGNPPFTGPDNAHLDLQRFAHVKLAAAWREESTSYSSGSSFFSR
jgi:serine/threonine protein kinase